jgi:peptide/histidine transporter 3/4
MWLIKAVSSSSIAVLSWADSLAWYAMSVMMTYLTNVWKLDLTHAAAIVNVSSGAANILPIAMSVLADTFLGHYCIILLANIAYSIVSFQNFLHF